MFLSDSETKPGRSYLRETGAPRLFKSILTVHLRLWVVILLLRNGGRWRMETETGEEHENRVDGGDK
jgi:hypothetical protein